MHYCLAVFPEHWWKESGRIQLRAADPGRLSKCAQGCPNRLEKNVKLESAHARCDVSVFIDCYKSCLKLNSFSVLKLWIMRQVGPGTGNFFPPLSSHLNFCSPYKSMQDINTFISRIYISLRMRGDVLAGGRGAELITGRKRGRSCSPLFDLMNYKRVAKRNVR